MGTKHPIQKINGLSELTVSCTLHASWGVDVPFSQFSPPLVLLSLLLHVRHLRSNVLSLDIAYSAVTAKSQHDCTFGSNRGNMSKVDALSQRRQAIFVQSEAYEETGSYYA